MEKITTKYEVKRFYVETKKGVNAYETWSNQTNQDTELLASYDTLAEAKEFYKTVETWVRSHGHYYQHCGKCIEINLYNENGDWVDGGDWIEDEIPEKQ